MTEERVERLRPHLRLCIPARRGRRRPAGHNKTLCKTRCRIENAVLCTPQGLARQLHAAHTRCGDRVLSAIALAASVIACWLP